MKPMVYIIHNRMIWILYDDRKFIDVRPAVVGCKRL